MTRLRTPLDVLRFWFGETYLNDRPALHTVSYFYSKTSHWFGSLPEFQQPQHDNAHLIEAAKNGHGFEAEEGGDWEQPRGLLARIILLDQFPRTVYRGTARAFAYDRDAVALARRLVDSNQYFSEFCAVERLFIQLPFAHSEVLADQEIGIAVGLRIAEGDSEEIKAFFEKLPGFPHEHPDVVRRFGRFPSRNGALGRETTPEEQAWLDSPDCPAWARSQMKPSA